MYGREYVFPYIGGGVSVQAGSVRPHGGLLRSYHDHRMVTFAAIIGLVVPEVLVEDVTATDKTLPGFADQWQALVAP